MQWPAFGLGMSWFSKRTLRGVNDFLSSLKMFNPDVIVHCCENIILQEAGT